MWVRWARLTIVHTIDGLKKKLGTFGTAKSLALAKNVGWQAKSAKSAFDHPPLASGRGGEAYFVIVTNVASGGGDVAYIVTNLALPLASLS